MMPLKTDVYHSELARIKENVEKAYTYFKPNYRLYNKARNFVFDTSLDPDTEAVLRTLKKPLIEFNVLESYVSRLRGEFSKQEPSIEVMAGDEIPVDVNTIKVVQGHIKHIICDANKNGFEYQIYTDTLAGGFSVAKVWTEYAHDLSFNQIIKVSRAYDPVLCGFDPLAREAHKGDGNFSFELFPMLKKDFIREYPDVNIDELSFSREIEGFNWSYKNQKDDIVLVADYYEKQKEKVTIVRLSNNQVLKQDEYKQFLSKWEEEGIIEQPPQVVEKRTSEVDRIKRYVFIDNQVLKEEDTDYRYLPHVFFDGNSMLLRHENDQAVAQKTRPYTYHAEGIQKLKNFAGQTLANEVENMIQHKFMIAEEALPDSEDYYQAWRDIQQTDLLVWKSTGNLSPDKPNPAPTVVPRQNIPQELIALFTGSDAMIQNILGSFDMDISKMSKSQVSGVALQEAITQNNSSAMPYIVGYLKGLGRIAELIVDLIPKYFKTPRTIPVQLPDGKKSYVPINQDQGIHLSYPENALNVHVEAGVNFVVQKERNFQTLIALQQASPLFAQFMAQEGLEFILDNVEMKGIDEIKQKAGEWQNKMRQMAEQQAEQAKNMPNPEMMKMQMKQMELQHKGNELQLKSQLEQSKMQLNALEMKFKQMENQLKATVAMEKAKTEIAAHMIDAHAKGHDQHLKHAEHILKVEEQHHKHRMDMHDRIEKAKENKHEHEERT